MPAILKTFFFYEINSPYGNNYILLPSPRHLRMDVWYPDKSFRFQRRIQEEMYLHYEPRLSLRLVVLLGRGREARRLP